MALTRDHSVEATSPVSLGPLLARSTRFKSLFTEGMLLVEDAATYLDGPGREDARSLEPALAEACSAESMRLTTRLMQIASWLLARRAVVDGEATLTETLGDRVKVTLATHARVSPQSVFLQLPLPLQRLTERSLRLQRRVTHLDRMVNEPNAGPAQTEPPAALEQQYALLRAAYAAQPADG